LACARRDDDDDDHHHHHVSHMPMNAPITLVIE
jgi:hypothetical protein